MRVIYFVELLLQHLKLKKFTYILLVFQILVSAIAFIIVLTMIRYFGYSFFTLSEFKDRSVMIVYDRNLDLQSKEDIAYENLSKNKGVKVEKIYPINIYEAESSTSEKQCFVYGDIISENLVLNLSAGVQLCDAEIRNGAHPIIVPEYSPYAEKFYSGEVFELYYRNLNGNSLKKYKSLNFYVCGLLKYPYRICLNLTSEPLIIEDFWDSPTVFEFGFDESGNMGTIDKSKDLDVTFFVMQDFALTDSMMISELSGSNCKFSVVEVNAEKNSNDYKKITADILEKYSVLSIKDLLNLGSENYSEGLGNYMVLFILLSLLSICGISGINLFLFDKLKTEYSLYFMCGARWSACVLFEAIRNFIVIFVPAVIGSVLGYLFAIGDPEVKYFVDFSYVLYVIIFVATIYLPSTAYFLIKLKKTKPIDNIRLMVKE